MLSSQLRNAIIARGPFAAKHAKTAATFGHLQKGLMSTSASESQLGEGEYLDEAVGQMYLNETVAKFSNRRRLRKNGQTID